VQGESGEHFYVIELGFFEVIYFVFFATLNVLFVLRDVQYTVCTRRSKASFDGQVVTNGAVGATLGPGATFGELALIHNGRLPWLRPTSANLTVETAFAEGVIISAHNDALLCFLFLD
jgi:CRP-like cAMP-binding protein